MPVGPEVLLCHGRAAGGRAAASVSSLRDIEQEANQASDGSAAMNASRDAQQLLQAVQSDDSFTMQVPPRRSPSRCVLRLLTLFHHAQSNLRSWTLELEALAAVLQ